MKVNLLVQMEVHTCEECKFSHEDVATQAGHLLLPMAEGKMVVAVVGSALGEALEGILNVKGKESAVHRQN